MMTFDILWRPLIHLPTKRLNSGMKLIMYVGPVKQIFGSVTFLPMMGLLVTDQPEDALEFRISER